MKSTATTLCLCFTAAQGFVVPTATTNHQAASSLNMLPLEFAVPLPFDTPTIPTMPDQLSPLPTGMMTPEDFSLSSEVSETVAEFPLPNRLARLFVGEPETIEEEVTNGVTHALLDFGSFWSQNALFIKGLAVVGRIVVLVHSLNSGHEVLVDELAFQLGFLSLSCHSLYQAAIPKMEANKASRLMTSKDRLAFRTLFRSAGFSWQQFREIHLQSMEWVTVEPGQVILDEAKDNAVFWLYRGDVHIKNEDKIMHSVSCADKTTMGLLGEHRMASLFDHGGEFLEDPTKTKSYAAGKSGATLLRIDIPKLGHFLQHHEEMTSNFGRLAFNAMQEKLNALRAVKAN